MKTKFDEFYYSGDQQVHPCDEFWDLYDKDKSSAMDKYSEDQIFCPSCHVAHLTVALGPQRRYFRAKNIAEHVNCDYQHEEMSSAAITRYKESLSKEEVESKLIYCLNRMLRASADNNVNTEKIINVKHHKNDSELVCTEKNVNKYLPTRNLYGLKESDCGKDKLYYGECLVWIRVLESENGKYSYIKIINKITRNPICDISLSSKVMYYAKNIVDDLPKNKDEAVVKKICIWSTLEKSNFGYKFILKNSVYMKIL